MTSTGRPKKERFIFGKAEFTDRELEFYQLIISGLDFKEIAGRLDICMPTVYGFRDKLFKQTGTRNNVGLVRFALKNKLINIDEFINQKGD